MCKYNRTNEDKVIIKRARKSLLYDNSEPRMKKDSIVFYVLTMERMYASW